MNSYQIPPPPVSTYGTHHGQQPQQQPDGMIQRLDQGLHNVRKGPQEDRPGPVARAADVPQLGPAARGAWAGSLPPRRRGSPPRAPTAWRRWCRMRSCTGCTPAHSNGRPWRRHTGATRRPLPFLRRHRICRGRMRRRALPVGPVQPMPAKGRGRMHSLPQSRHATPLHPAAR